MSDSLKRLFGLSIMYWLLISNAQAQTKPFVPLDYEYPPALLTNPKTYVYKNAITGALQYKDVSFERKGSNVIIHWKQYDNSPIVDSATEVNDKTYDHYMIISSTAVKMVVSEDSVYHDGSKLGERLQTFYIDLSTEISLFGSVRSSFLKDTSVAWKGNQVPCLVIQSYQMQRLTNSLFPDKPKELNGIIYYYFGKDVGLLMYRSESEQDRSTWQLVDIKESREK